MSHETIIKGHWNYTTTLYHLSKVDSYINFKVSLGFMIFMNHYTFALVYINWILLFYNVFHVDLYTYFDTIYCDISYLYIGMSVDCNSPHRNLFLQLIQLKEHKCIKFLLVIDSLHFSFSLICWFSHNLYCREIKVWEMYNLKIK